MVLQGIVDKIVSVFVFCVFRWFKFLLFFFFPLRKNSTAAEFIFKQWSVAMYTKNLNTVHLFFILLLQNQIISKSILQLADIFYFTFSGLEARRLKLVKRKCENSCWRKKKVSDIFQKDVIVFKSRYTKLNVKEDKQRLYGRWQ